jgi:hypothetical protein
VHGCTVLSHLKTGEFVIIFSINTCFIKSRISPITLWTMKKYQDELDKIPDPKPLALLLKEKKEEERLLQEKFHKAQLISKSEQLTTLPPGSLKEATKTKNNHTEVVVSNNTEVKELKSSDQEEATEKIEKKIELSPLEVQSQDSCTSSCGFLLNVSNEESNLNSKELPVSPDILFQKLEGNLEKSTLFERTKNKDETVDSSLKDCSLHLSIEENATIKKPKWAEVSDEEDLEESSFVNIICDS